MTSRLLTLCNSYTSNEMREVCIMCVKEMLMLWPAEMLKILVPLLHRSHSNASNDNADGNFGLGPYFPRKGGVLHPRGTVEVREVQSDMAMVGLLGEPDPFDPILPGDVIRNPHFEKGRVLRFHLLGDYPLTLSKDFVTARLLELGAHVDETLDTGTDVVVLGEKSLAEGEFAQELTETEEYKLADKLGMRIIRLDDLAGFLRY